ncbi:hypothetical protein ACI6PS_01315 [Flavobacterium sp. PLA-1-15]|uniref:hypothetical protein n=1 Tax=Flavobacterium sp. PLA-1-15 TaxID=3380533 RepID=UPI003B7ED0D2
MARINTKGLLTGTVGNYSFKILNGVAVVQSKPGKGGVKQTTATKSSASEFGNAHAVAKQIRLAQFPLLQDLSDARMYNRFATAIYKTILSAKDMPKGERTLADGDLENLEHFQFNADSPFYKYCNAPMKVSMNEENRIAISIDSFDAKKDIESPENASEAKLAFLVTTFHPKDGTESHAELFQFTFALSNDATAPQQWTSEMLPAGSIALVSVALFYSCKNNLIGSVGLNSKKLHPSEIIKAFRL